MGQRADVRFGAAKDDWFYNAASGGLTTTTNTAMAPAVAGLAVAITTFSYKNISAVASEITITDGAGGSVLFRGAAPASMLYADVINFTPPIVNTPGNSLVVKMATNATQTYINANGYYLQRTA